MKRGNKKTQRSIKNPQKILSLFSTNVTRSVDFFNTESGLYRTKSPLTSSPFIVTNEDFVFFVFEDADNETIKKLNNIFSNLTKGTTFTVTDGLYRDTNLGIEDISFADTYEFLEYDKKTKYIKATKPASLNLSDKIEKYNIENFVLRPQIEVSSLTNSTPLYGVINYFGVESSNSFIMMGASEGYTLVFKGTSNNDDIKFKIRFIYEDDEGREIVIFDEGQSVAETLIGVPILVDIYYEDGNYERHHINPNLDEYGNPNPPLLPAPPKDLPTITEGECDCPSTDHPEQPPILPADHPDQTFPGGHHAWYLREQKCCECLVYGESTCNRDCQSCLAWSLRNRRLDPHPKGSVSGDETSKCKQAVDQPSQYSGSCTGIHPYKFKACLCNKKVIIPPDAPGGIGPGIVDPSKPSEKACLDGAAFACAEEYEAPPNPLPTGQEGDQPTDEELEKFRKSQDPTGGANYFHACYLNKPKFCKPGRHAHDIACNIKAGVCKKTQSGKCKNCPTCFYRCDSMPHPCHVLKRQGKIDKIPTAEECEKIHKDAPDTLNSLIEDSATGVPRLPGPSTFFDDAIYERDETDVNVTQPNFGELSKLSWTGTLASFIGAVERGELGSTGPTGGTGPQQNSTGPFAVAGYYPLYTTKEAALEVSPSPNSRRPGDRTVGYHIHRIAGINYYMPNGLQLGRTQFHGDFPYEFDPDGTGQPFGAGAVAQTTTTPTTPSTPITPSASTTTSTPSTPSPPSAPSSSPPSGGGGGGGYGY